MRAGISHGAIAVLTSFSVACGGHGCAVGPVAVASGKEQGNQPSAAELRRPVAEARLQLAKAMRVPTDPDALGPGDLAKQMENAIEAAETAERSLSRIMFDPAAVVRVVGRDPVKLFEWVRDHTFLVPYEGSLRGATGVLMDRLGNSLDRALLLESLLRSSGATARLAHATLSSEQAASLVPLTERTPLIEAVAHDGVVHARAAGGEDAELHSAFEHVDRAAQQMRARFKERATSQADEIAHLLGRSSVSSESAVPAGLSDHWWVQYRRGAEWIDLDPAAPDAVPGRRVVEPQEVMASTDLPDDARHRITVRVVIEQWSSGELRETTALEHTLRPSDLIGQRIVLRHRPENWPETLDLTGEQAQQRLQAVLLQQQAWVPVLVVGDQNISQSRFDASGGVGDPEVAPGKAGSPQGVAAGFLDAFGGGEEEQPAPGHLTAEWIEYEIRVPGESPRTIRRDVFDLLGPAARASQGVSEPRLPDPVKLQRSLTLLGETEMLPLVCQLPDEFVTHVMHASLLRNRETVQQLIQQAANGSMERVAQLIGRLDVPSGELYALALSRRVLSPVAADVYLARPNILSFHGRVRVDDTGGLVRAASIDIVANDVAVRTHGNGDSFRARLLQGVVDTAAEALLVGNCAGCGAEGNVSELWVSSWRLGQPWVTVRSASGGIPKSIKLESDARVRVEDDLADGYAVVMPAGRVAVDGRSSFGWWRIDSTSGAALGIMESGEGQALAEYPKLSAAIASGATLVGTFSCLGRSGNAPLLKVVICLACGAFAGWAAMTSLHLGGGPSGAHGVLAGNICGAISFLM